MNAATAFVLLNVLLQAGALVAYIARGQWNDAVYWFGAATINGAVLWRSWA